MLRLPKFITKTLSTRLSLIVVSSMAILLMASLAVMLRYSRKTIKAEALQKASQTLDATVQQLDNIMLSVEQTAGNIYFNLMPHLNDPDMVSTFCRQLVEANPYINGCAIAFRPNYYSGRKYFMVCFQRSEDARTIVQADIPNDGSYLGQEWFSAPMKSSIPKWTDPMEGRDASQGPVIRFCLPIPGNDGQPVGVIGANVTLSLLSNIVAAAKPSENSYCTLLDSHGSYIVHPVTKKMVGKKSAVSVSSGYDPSIADAAKAMMSGETGYRPFSMDGTDYYVFYKPFQRFSVAGRSMEELGWSAGIIYPADDIFGDYKKLVYYVLAIAAVGILLLFILCRIIIHHQVKPLIMLAGKAQRIAKGNYDESIPDSHQKDEIGRLQDNFQLMQQSLALNISDMEQLKVTLKERGDELRTAYNQAQKADRLKTSFLHNMTNQMLGPADAIDQDVSALSESSRKHMTCDTNRLADDIQKNGNTIAELLNNLLRLSNEDIERDNAHD